MSRAPQQLLLKIEQAGRVQLHRLSKRGRLTVGQDPANDVTLYGEHFPKKHVLFYRKNNHFRISLQQYMEGEVYAGKSKLTFRDLIVHGLLPRKGDGFTYPLTAGKNGYVALGDARIWFKLVDEERTAGRPQKFSAYSWTYATLKELGRDLPFKAILLLLVFLHAFILSYMNKLPSPLEKNRPAAVVPERLAKIIVRTPAANPPEETAAAIASAPEEVEENAAKRQPEGKKSGAPENQGLLGLLTGTGSSSQSNSLADFLLDKELVKEIDQVVSSTDLTVGKGSDEGDKLDDLISATSNLDTGIDEVLEDLDTVQPVALGKKGQIRVDRVGGLTASKGALGKRSEDSVRSVLLSYTGRLTYIYNKYLKRNPQLAGKMVVEVVIAADGHVARVKVVSSNLDNPEFEREILNFIQRWTYPRIDQGTVTVTYPLFFNKIG